MGHDLRHVFEVVHDEVVAGERFAEFMPDDGLRVGLPTPEKAETNKRTYKRSQKAGGTKNS